MPNRKILLAGAALAVVVVLLAGWWWRQPPPPVAGNAGAEAAASTPDRLEVAADEAARLGIQAAPAEAATRLPLATIPAVIQPPANARVAVAAIFPGVVTRTLVVEGDHVRQGQPLARISSREVLALGADLARARARLGVARSAAARMQELSRDGIIAPARADEAGATLAEAEADASEKERSLKLANGDGASGTYVLTAPIAGRVTRATLAAGDPVDGGSAPYVIDAADRYEAAGQLPERLVGVVKTGMEVAIQSGEATVVGRVVAVGSTIDPATRSASLKAELPAGAEMVSGRSTGLSLFAPAPDGAVGVPVSAVTKLAGADVVFVPVAGGYALRPVQVAGTGDGRMVLSSGLLPGDLVVTDGVSALKALALAQ